MPEGTRTIAIVNEKGGVGKTTTTAHLGHALATEGYTTVVVDMDGQATATEYMLSGENGEPPSIDHGLYQLLWDQNVDGLDCLQISESFKCVVLPSSMELKTWFLDVVFQRDPEDLAKPILKQRLRALSESFLEATGEPIDYYLIDAPPSFGSLYLQSLMASDELLVPVTLETLSINGIRTFTETLKGLQDTIDYEPNVLTVLPCMVDRRRRTQTPKKLRELRDALGDLVAPKEMQIPVNSELAKAGTPPSASNSAMKAYRNLGRWIAQNGEH